MANTFRIVLTRGLAVMALLCIYCFGFVGSALILGASSTAAFARGRGGGGFRGGGFRGGGFRGGGFRGGGFRGGGFRGAGFGALGVGLGLGLYSPYGYGGYGYGYPYGYSSYYGGDCYLVRQRIWTPYGWRLRRIQVCG